MRKRIGFMALALLFALASTYAQKTRCFVYITNSGSADVSAYAIDPSKGALRDITKCCG